MLASSLYSKFIDKDKQGMGQAMFSNASAIAYIIGPLWGVRLRNSSC